MKEKIYLYKIILSDEKGSAIVIAMMTLLIVTIIGLSTIDNSITEKTIATNEILHQQAFYAADGGTEVAQKLIESNIETADTSFKAGFTDDGKNLVYKDNGKTILTVECVKTNKTDKKATECVSDDTKYKFWQNDRIDKNPWEDGTSSDDYRDFYINTAPGITNFKTSYKISDGPTPNIQGGGTEGVGKSSIILPMTYTIYAQHRWDDRNVKSTIKVQWRYIYNSAAQ